MRWILTLAFACTGSATAGPLGWDYSIRAEAINGGSRVYAGYLEWVDVDPGTVSTYDVSSHFSLGFESTSGVGTDGEPIRMYNMPVESGNLLGWHADRPGDMEDAFYFIVGITDRDTGEYGEVKFLSRAHVEFNSRWSPVRAFYDIYGFDSVRVGDTQYDVRVERNGPSSYDQWIDTTIVSAPAVPEPSSLILAGMAVVGWRVRRKR